MKHDQAKSCAEFDKELDAWLDTEAHRLDCAAADEGQPCCLDTEGFGHPKLGRAWVKDFIRRLLPQGSCPHFIREQEQRRCKVCNS